MYKRILVYPHELADIPDPEFPWKEYTEEDYKNFLSDQRVQAYITAFDPDNPEYNKPHFVDDSDLHYVFIDIANAVCVVKSPDGFVCGSNGRHRLYISKKYNLPIIAVDQGEISFNPYIRRSEKLGFRDCIKALFKNYNM